MIMEAEKSQDLRESEGLSTRRADGMFQSKSWQTHQPSCANYSVQVQRLEKTNILPLTVRQEDFPLTQHLGSI
jgi:hypothetical protein